MFTVASAIRKRTCKLKAAGAFVVPLILGPSARLPDCHGRRVRPDGQAALAAAACVHTTLRACPASRVLRARRLGPTTLRKRC
jgi:hypothetical protein